MRRRTARAVALVSGSVFIATLVAVVFHRRPFPFDLRAADVFAGWWGMDVVTRLGSLPVLIPVVAVAALLLAMVGRDVRAAVLLVAGLAGAVVLYDVTKVLVDRPRPATIPGMSSYAFPSGHTVAATVVWGMLAAILARGRRRSIVVMIWTVALVIVVAVGASRIALGVHWTTDVIGGLALGLCWLSILEWRWGET